MPPNEPDAILFETSPYENIDAIVQHDGRVVFFYLNGHATNGKNAFGTRAVWVQNLIEAPYVLDEDEAEAGIAPMLPRTHCKNPKPQPLPDADQLEVVWFEEGNGAALRMTTEAGKTETLAVIPPWSGLEGFHGYASGCAAESPLCWPMPDNPRLQQRVDDSAEFWAACASDAHPFSMLQPKILAAYEETFSTNGSAQRGYFSIDGGHFPPRGLATFQANAKSPMIVATVGLSLCPQPAVELFSDDPSSLRRIELAVQLTAEQAADRDLVDSVSQQISGLAAYPWRNLTWLGPGHTCGLTGLAPESSSALLVSDQQYRPDTTASLPKFRGDPLNLLWLVPITQTQQKQLESNEITVESILS